MHTDSTPSPAPGTADTPQARTYTLAELVEPGALARVTEAFARLTGGELVIVDTDGRRLDRRDTGPSDDHDAGSGGYSLPVRWNEHVLGSVVIRDDKPTDAQRELAAFIVDVLACLCRGEARVRRRVTELTTVYDLGGLFAGTLDLRTMLDKAARRVCQVLRAKAAAIRLLDEKTGELVLCGTYNLSDAYINKGVVRADGNTIDAEAFRGQVVHVKDVRTDPRSRYPEHARREGLVSALSCPMIYRGRTVGVIRAYRGQIDEFSDFETELLRAVASQAAGAVVNSRLIAEQLRVNLQQRQFHDASQVQRRMIPRRSPDHPHLHFGHVYEPSLQLGGDFFDMLDLPDGNIGLAIADVVGKGAAASLMMASVRASLRAYAHSIFDIDEIMARVNRHMCRDTLVAEFATLCYGVFTPDGRRFTYCNAGHCPPLLFRKDAVTRLETGGMAIGINRQEVYERQVIDLQPHDLLVFYTDGVTEALDFDEVSYGLDRLVQSAQRHRGKSASTICNQLLWDVRRFAGLTEQLDDITIVVAQIT